MDDDDRLAQRYIDEGFVPVRDPELVRKYLRRGHCRPQVYERLVQLTAETGALMIPFRSLPEVQSILRQKQEDKGN